MPLKSGSVLLDGKSITKYSVHKRIKEGMVYVPEDRAGNGIFSIASVKENITAASLNSMSRFFLNTQKRKRFMELYIKQFRIVVPI